jgi:TMEM175 potassium channel family protein
VTTSRLEYFADGVLAIAATLLIIGVSVEAPGAELGPALKHAWPQYAAYAVSFLIVGIWWVNHHAFFALLGRADRTFLFINIALLACIAFLPFPTGLVAAHFRDDGVRAAAIVYGLTMTAAAICFVSAWFYAATGRRLIADAVDQRQVDGMTRSVLPGVPINAAATLIALWSPYTALALFAALALFYVIGSTLFGRATELEPRAPIGTEL